MHINSKYELDVVHTIDDGMLEGRCCISHDVITCIPTLSGPCQDAICSVGMAGSGLFKLGCLSVENYEVKFNTVLCFVLS